MTRPAVLALSALVVACGALVLAFDSLASPGTEKFDEAMSPVLAR
jgi:hypothetical protein